MKQSWKTETNHKKYASVSHGDSHYRPNPDIYVTPYRHISTKESKNILEACMQLPSIQSSRIAEEDQGMDSQFQRCNEERSRYVQYGEEIEDILEKKEREVYFLRVEIGNYDVRLQESQEECRIRQEEIIRLRAQIQRLMKNDAMNASQQYALLQQENEELKIQLQRLIEERNESLSTITQKEYQSTNTNYLLKREVEELRTLIAQMQINIQNCPSCFTLRRDNEQLAHAYSSLQKQYSDIVSNKTKQEKTLLQSITSKIQQNQNIIRQNLQLKDKKAQASQLRLGRQKMKASIAQRCRTLTEQSL